MILHISDQVDKKLQKREIGQFHLLECFGNQTRSALIDEREEHKTDPPTQWFIAETDSGRRLKVVYIQITVLDFVIKTAYDPDASEEDIYQKYSVRL